MTGHPEAYILAAFGSLDIAVHDLKVTNCSPTAFGNLDCHADTAIGRLRIVYDRQFEIEIVGEQKSGDMQIISALIKALDEAKRKSRWNRRPCRTRSAARPNARRFADGEARQRRISAS